MWVWVSVLLVLSFVGSNGHLVSDVHENFDNLRHEEAKPNPIKSQLVFLSALKHKIQFLRMHHKQVLLYPSVTWCHLPRERTRTGNGSYHWTHQFTSRASHEIIAYAPRILVKPLSLKAGLRMRRCRSCATRSRAVFVEM